MPPAPPAARPHPKRHHLPASRGAVVPLTGGPDPAAAARRGAASSCSGHGGGGVRPFAQLLQPPGQPPQAEMVGEDSSGGYWSPWHTLWRPAARGAGGRGDGSGVAAAAAASSPPATPRGSEGQRGEGAALPLRAQPPCHSQCCLPPQQRPTLAPPPPPWRTVTPRRRWHLRRPPTTAPLAWQWRLLQRPRGGCSLVSAAGTGGRGSLLLLAAT